jgi:acyl-CoA thioesterase
MGRVVRRVAPQQRGEVRAWARLTKPIGDDPALQACALAYISDDFPTEAVVSLMPGWDPHVPPERQFFSASLDHAIWFIARWRSTTGTCMPPPVTG